jgi:hypothetical protein
LPEGCRLGQQSENAGLEQASAKCEFFPLVAAGQETAMPDAFEAGWLHMNQEAANELVRVYCHGARFLLVFVTVVLPLESDLAVADIEQALIGDGDFVCVTAEISQRLLRSAEGRFS